MVQEKQGNIFDLYADWTDTVAKYPVTAEPYYLALGIADEIGELCGCDADNVVKEAGDVLWYCARYAKNVLRVNFSVIVEDKKAGMCDISEQVGILCGVEKKRIRDGHMWNNEVRAKKTEAAYAALVQIVGWVALTIDLRGRIAYDLSTDVERNALGYAVQMNMGKLEARAAAGTLQGDGDHR